MISFKRRAKVFAVISKRIFSSNFLLLIVYAENTVEYSVIANNKLWTTALAIDNCRVLTDHWGVVTAGVAISNVKND